MILALAFLFGLLRLADSQLYTAPSATAYMYNNTAMVKTNCLNGTTGLSPTIPYHYLQLYPNDTILYAFGFNNVSTSSQSSHSVQYLSINRRADFRSPVLLSLALAYSNTTPSSGYTMVRLMTLTAASNFTASGSLTFHIAGVGFSISSGSPTNVSTGGLTFRYYSPAVYYNTGYATSVNSTLDLDFLLAFGVQAGAISPLDLLSYLTVVSYITYGTGSLETDHLLRFLAKPSFKTGDTATCMGWVFNLEILASNNTLSDYYNITLPEVPTSLGDLVFSFLQTAVMYNAKATIKLGNHNKTWVTVLGNYSLPVAANASTQLLASMTTSQTAGTGQIGVCFAMNLRSDWNAGAYTAAKLTPDREIQVCPWWSVQSQGSLVAGPLLYDGVVYNLYTVTATVSGVTWPVHIFAAVNNTLSVNSTDLMGFVRYLMTNLSIVAATETVAGVEFGYRVYFGSGIWTTQSFNLVSAVGLGSSTVTTYVPPSPSSSTALISTGCPFSVLDNSSNQCRTNPTLITAVQTIIATPNLGLIFQVTSFLWAVDDLAYYAYHQRSYDPAFEFSAQTAWTLTNQKWMLPALQSVYSNVQTQFEAGVPNKNVGENTPFTYSLNGEDAYFLRGTVDIWLCSIPFTVTTFFLLKLVRRLFSSTSIARLLARFEFNCFLLLGIVGENVQYLTFRCLSQLYQLVPNGDWLVAYTNLAVCYTVFFVVVVWSVCGYVMLNSHLRKSKHLLFEGFAPSDRSVAHFTCIMMLRVVNGAAHGLLYSHQVLQISILLGVQIVILTLSIANRKQYLSKMVFLGSISDGLIRICLHVSLFIEVTLIDLVSTANSVIIEFGISTSLFVECLMVMGLLQVVFNIITSSRDQQKSTSSNKINSVLQQSQALRQLDKRWKGKKVIIQQELIFQTNYA